MAQMKISSAFLLTLALFSSVIVAQTPHTLRYGSGKSITLTLPSGFDIHIAATGLGRVRFFAFSPDHRIFVSCMHDLEDNRLGSVLILEGWDPRANRFTRITHYLDHLRNPNNVAFWTDPETRQSWIYIPLTDRLIRYKYKPGDNAPTSKPETLIRFPDYGLSYKYGGWHLTRTVAFAQVNGATRVFVAVGSSCNYCQEREVLRAAIVSMQPDGRDAKIVARGMRNAVDLHAVRELNGNLFATDMGDDHLGDRAPEDTLFRVDASPSIPPDYGWPSCYFASGKAIHDNTPLPALNLKNISLNRPSSGGDSVYGYQAGVASAGTNLTAGGDRAFAPDPNATLGHAPPALTSCGNVPAAYTTFPAHSSPLGFAYFGRGNRILRDTFLTALHGASHTHIGTGYRVVQFTPADRNPRDFITGFLTQVQGRVVVHGRPCGLLQIGPDRFLLSDDYLGLVYVIGPPI